MKKCIIPIATKVKPADLKHNTDLTGNNGIKTRKYDTYLEAIAYLTE